MIGDFAYHALTRLGIKETVKAFVPHSLMRPWRPALKHEILALESKKSDWNLIELRAASELAESSWRGLGSLAYEIICAYKPKVVVELGSHMGLSTFSMALGIRDLNEGGRVYAVDTWKGDAQAGRYGEDVYECFLSRRKQLGLEKVIQPLRMTFEEAHSKVPPEIDLLHIDGLHTWQAVNQDFEMYSPLMRSGGLVLFHDVNTGFPELKKYWRRLCRRYEHYLIPYSHGFGIIRV
jgi:O-antigen biosynthesis protein